MNPVNFFCVYAYFRLKSQVPDIKSTLSSIKLLKQKKVRFLKNWSFRKLFQKHWEIDLSMKRKISELFVLNFV